MLAPSSGSACVSGDGFRAAHTIRVTMHTIETVSPVHWLPAVSYTHLTLPTIYSV